MTVRAVADDQRRQYREQGYFVFEGAVDAQELALLCDACDASVERVSRSMRQRGVSVEFRSILDDRYITIHERRFQPRLDRVIFGEAMAELCRATIGDDAWLAAEIFAVKAPGGSPFPWHQDPAQATPVIDEPFVVIWVALDDMTEANGGLRVLPFDRAPTTELVPQQVRDKRELDFPDEGDLIELSAGDALVYDGRVFHQSGVNRTDDWRRAFAVGYCAAPGEHAILRGGERVVR